MKKFFAMLLAVVMLASCAGFAMADEPTTITVWHRWSGSNEAFLNEVLDAFQAEHPEVKIEVSAKAGEYFELLQSMIADAAAGNPCRISSWAATTCSTTSPPKWTRFR